LLTLLELLDDVLDGRRLVEDLLVVDGHVQDDVGDGRRREVVNNHVAGPVHLLLMMMTFS